MIQSHLVTIHTSTSCLHNNNSHKSISRDAVWPGMLFTDWKWICYVAVGPSFTRSTDCVIHASGCKKELDVCTVFWKNANEVHDDSFCILQCKPTSNLDPFTLRTQLCLLAVFTVKIRTVITIHTLAYCILVFLTLLCIPLVVTWKRQRVIESVW